MPYLSQVINKPLQADSKDIGKVIDITVTDNRPTPPITKLLVKKNKKKFAIQAAHVTFSDDKWHMNEQAWEELPYDEKDFYLAEDLLDKQVIDLNGRRLVRVNDVLLKEKNGLLVEGIDIGFGGILRRLGLGNWSLKTITLPWSLIEAFDYQTGTVKVKLTQNKLNNLHPAEVADILEEAGTKERLGILESLDAQRAASAIEEADPETQSAILEQVPSTHLQNIIGKMHVSEIADILQQMNPFTSNSILNALEDEKAKKVQKLLVFEEDEAGGIMDSFFYHLPADYTVVQALAYLSENKIHPEAIAIIAKDEKVVGTVFLKDLITQDPNLTLKDCISSTQTVDTNTPFTQIMRLFAEYNLRILPVVDTNYHMVGIITIDHILERLQEEEEREDAI